MNEGSIADARPALKAGMYVDVWLRRSPSRPIRAKLAPLPGTKELCAAIAGGAIFIRLEQCLRIAVARS